MAALACMVLSGGASAATLDITAGSLTYTASAGINNNFTITATGLTYTITDTGETITLTAGAMASGWTGSGTNTVTGPTSSVATNFTVNLMDGTDSLEIGANVSIGGTMNLQSGGSITQSSATLIVAASLSMLAGTGIGSVAAPITTQIASLAANTVTGGIFLSNQGGTLNIGFGGETVQGVMVTGASGDISIVNNGSIIASGSIVAVSNGDVIQGPGNITVEALGPNADLQTGGQGTSSSIAGTGGGQVTVTATRDLLLGDDTGFGSVTSANGSLTLTCNRNLTLNANASVSVLAGNGALQALAPNIVMDTSTGTNSNWPLFSIASGSLTLATPPGGAFTGASRGINAVSSTNGLINVVADTISFSQGIYSNGPVLLAPAGPTMNTQLGGTNSPGTLVLSDAELGLVTAGQGLTIGGGPGGTGNLTIESPINTHPGYSQLILATAGNFIGNAATLSANSLTFLDFSVTGRTWTISDTAIQESANAPIPLTHPRVLAAEVGTSRDTFNVTPSVNTQFEVVGNAGAFPGNALVLSSYTNATLNITSDNAAGMGGYYTFTGGTQLVFFQGLESGLFNPPSITESFGAASIGLNAGTTLTFTLAQANPTPVAGLASLAGVAFSDSLPSGLTATGVVSNTCGGSVSGSSILTLSGGGSPVNGSCQIQVNVTGSTAGTKINTTSAVTAHESGPGSSGGSAQVVVTPAVNISSPGASYGSGGATVTVTVTTNTTTATGAIALSVDSGAPISRTLNGGSTVFTLANLSAGPHSLTVNYSAGNFANASGNGTLTVSKANTLTTLTAPRYSGPGTLSAAVMPVAPAAGTPTGSVQFLTGSISLGTVTLANGTASLSLTLGAATITAVYSGDTDFLGSSSAPAGIVETPSASLSLTSSANPSTLGQPVTFTAALNSNESGTPSGTVQFSDFAKPLASINLTGGQRAAFTTSTLGAGQHNIGAVYSGDAFLPSASAVLVQFVTVSLPITASVSPAAPAAGQAVTITAQVTPSTIPAGFSGPTGNVQFVENGMILGTAALSSGTASVTLNNLAAGSQSIVVLYLGDGTWPTANTTVTFTVGGQQSTATTLSVAPGSSGQAVLKALVSPGAATGTVKFTDTTSNMVLATAPLNAGGVTTTVALSALAHAIVAAYSGDSNYLASASNPLPMAVSGVGTISSAFARDEIVSLFDIGGLGGDTAATLPLATSLAGVTVKLTDSNGADHAALLYGVFASASQVNTVFPSDVPSGVSLLTVTLPGGGTLTNLVTIANTAPGIFTANQNGQGVYAGQVIDVHADESETVGSPAVLDSTGKTYIPNPIAWASGTDQVYLILYGTGLRHAASVTATVNGVTVPAVFAAQSQYPGLDQVNLEIPPSLAGSGTVNIAIAADGQAANIVTAAFQ